MDAFFKCLRWFVCVINFIFWIVGMAVLCVGLWLRFDPHVQEQVQLNADRLHEYNICAYVLIVIGALMSVLGFLGCCGAWRKSQCMLVSFFILLLIVFLGELVCGIVAYLQQEKIKDYVSKSMMDVILKQYGNNAEMTKVIDNIQNHLDCCGVQSYMDWRHSSYGQDGVVTGEVELGLSSTMRARVPKSCCNQDGLHTYSDCGSGTSFINEDLALLKHYLKQKGCLDGVVQKFYDNLDIMIGVSVGIGFFQPAANMSGVVSTARASALLGMLFSMMLCCWIGYSKDRERKGGY